MAFRRLAAALITAVLLAGGTLAARAQVGPEQIGPTVPTLPSTSTTTTTSAPPSSTTSTTSPVVPDRPAPPPGDDGPDDGQAPPEAGGGEPPPPGSTPEPPDGAIGGDSAEEPVGARVPPELQALIDSVPRTRANNTRRLLEALQPLQDLGLSAEEAAIMGMGRFPVAGYASFVDDWWFPRFVPEVHLHEGTDIFAAAGTPVRSPADGVLRQVEGPIGGLAVYVDLPEGGYIYMAHLAGFAPGQVSGQPVRTGEVVGFVGDSGNAKGGSPHVHFELHPAPTREVTVGRGRDQRTEVQTVAVTPGTPLPPVNPKPHLDQWLEDAIAGVPSVVASYQASRPRALLATGLTRRLTDGSGVFGAPRRPSPSQLLWASSANPASGGLAIAAARADALAESVSWAEEPVTRPPDVRSREKAVAGRAVPWL